MRLARWTLCAAVLGVLCIPAMAFAITIDATALTTYLFSIQGVTGALPTASMQSVALGAGSYDFVDHAGNTFAFTVDGGGDVNYAPALESFVHGAGSSHLVVRGFDFTFDATALTTYLAGIPGINAAQVPTNVVQPVTGIPGTSYVFNDHAGNNFSFEIDANGLLRYAPALENFVHGAGSSHLVVSGFAFTIDACGLVSIAPAIAILGIAPPSSTGAPLIVVGIPGTNYTLVAGTASADFSIDGSGLLQGLPTLFDGQPVSGNGTRLFGIGACAGVGSIAGRVVADCPAANTPLLGVRVDAFEVGSGDLAGGAATDAGGNYSIGSLPSGPYTVTIVTPLGYTAAAPEVPATVSGGQTAAADYALHCVTIAANPRGSGFWMHQIGVATGGHGQAQVSAATLCSYLDLIAAHFNSNAVNPVVVYVPPVSGTCSDKLQVARALINLVGSAATKARAKQQLAALLLNVAAGYISQTQVISTDGVTVSQAITYCDNLIDSPTGDYERARTIADLINNGLQVPAGMVPTGTRVIAYSVKPAGASTLTLEGLRPNPASGSGLNVAFALPAGAPARLELLDVNGRRVLSREVGSRGAGWHTVNLAEGHRVPPGLYWVRLTQGANQRTTRVAVVE